MRGQTGSPGRGPSRPFLCLVPCVGEPTLIVPDRCVEEAPDGSKVPPAPVELFEVG